MGQQHRSSTSKTYLNIWRQFNQFLIKLDKKPDRWEDRVTLFVGQKIEEGVQSTTIKTYISAIKNTLATDGYPWEDNRFFLNSLRRACKMINDTVYTRLPIEDN